MKIANAKTVLADDSGEVHSFYEAGDVERSVDGWQIAGMRIGL